MCSDFSLNNSVNRSSTNPSYAWYILYTAYYINTSLTCLSCRKALSSSESFLGGPTGLTLICCSGDFGRPRILFSIVRVSHCARFAAWTSNTYITVKGFKGYNVTATVTSSSRQLRSVFSVCTNIKYYRSFNSPWAVKTHRHSK